MINYIDILIILASHFVFDFVLQTEWQAVNKSKNVDALVQHTSVYAMCWMPIIFCLCFLNHGIYWKESLLYASFFSVSTFILHTTQDHITSRINSKLAEKARETQKWHNFFVAIGFDQFLHYCQLFGFYLLLFI